MNPPEPAAQGLVLTLARLETGAGLTSYAARKLPEDLPANAIPQRTGAAASNERAT